MTSDEIATLVALDTGTRSISKHTEAHRGRVVDMAGRLSAGGVSDGD
jgi:hypothetical protein